MRRKRRPAVELREDFRWGVGGGGGDYEDDDDEDDGEPVSEGGEEIDTTDLIEIGIGPPLAPLQTTLEREH